MNYNVITVNRKTATRGDPRHSQSQKCSSCSLDPENGEKSSEEWVDLGRDSVSGGRSPRTDEVDGRPQNLNGIESVPDGANHVNSVSPPGYQGKVNFRKASCINELVFL